MEINEAINEVRKTLVQDKGATYRLAFASPEEHLRMGLQRYAGQDYQWLESYDDVVDWMKDTKGKGLMLAGNCGLGKTLIARYIIPRLLEYNFSLICNCHDATDLAQDPDAIMKNKIIMIDDVGTENETVKYGMRRIAFAELVDKAEKEGKLLILTTNLTPSEIQAKYGERVLDRLIALTRCIVVSGESMRRNKNQ